MRKTKIPADLTDPNAETAFYDRKADLMTAVEERIMAAVPSTLAGALVQLSVIIESDVADAAPPQKDIDATLAGIVAGQGATS